MDPSRDALPKQRWRDQWPVRALNQRRLAYQETLLQLRNLTGRRQATSRTEDL